jgi:hypothetical protein
VKNKHLVWIFLVTLVLGGMLARFWPFGRSTALQRPLLQVDTAQAVALNVLAPGYPPYSLHREAVGWTLLVDNRVLPITAQQAATMLGAAAKVNSIQVFRSRHPDSVGLAPGQYLLATWTLADGRRHGLHIGKETDEGTWVQLPGQQAVFLAAGRLRSKLAVDVRQFRNAAIWPWPLPDTDSFALWRADTLMASWCRERGDTIPGWLARLAPSAPLPFADFFDETRATRMEALRIELFRRDTPATLTLYQWEPANLPEALQGLRPIGHALAPYVWHSSANPLNYFAMRDTLLIGPLLAGSLTDSTAHDQ